MTTFSIPMQNVMLGAMVTLVLLILLALVYAIRSQRFTDKIVAANMIGTLTMNIVVIFAIYLGQSYILDTGIIIAMLSFLSVIVLCRVVTDHIFGQLRHMRDKEGELTKEHIAKVGTEDHTVRRGSHAKDHPTTNLDQQQDPLDPTASDAAPEDTATAAQAKEGETL